MISNRVKMTFSVVISFIWERGGAFFPTQHRLVKICPLKATAWASLDLWGLLCFRCGTVFLWDLLDELGMNSWSNIALLVTPQTVNHSSSFFLFVITWSQCGSLESQRVRIGFVTYDKSSMIFLKSKHTFNST